MTDDQRVPHSHRRTVGRHRHGAAWTVLALVGMTLLDRLTVREPAPRTAPRSCATPARTPTAADPLRIYLGGDSVAVAFAQAFSRLAGETGVVRTRADYHYASGLAHPEYFDWPAQLREQLAVAPLYEVVILLLGGNDAKQIRTPSGELPFGRRAWQREYRRRVGAGPGDVRRHPAAPASRPAGPL